MDKFSQNDKELLIKINEVLHYLWDPIGVAGVPQARDEYDSYALQVFSLLKKNAGSGEIANYLSNIIVDRMGLNKNAEHDMKIANTLVEWKSFYDTK